MLKFPNYISPLYVLVLALSWETTQQQNKDTAAAEADSRLGNLFYHLSTIMVSRSANCPSAYSTSK